MVTDRNEPCSDTRKEKSKITCAVLSWFRHNGFLILLVLSTVAGYTLGYFLQPFNFSKYTVHVIGFPGELVLRSFLMIIVPLLFCSIVLGLSNLQNGGHSRIFALTIIFFVSLSILMAILGAVAGHVIHPGRKISSEEPSKEAGVSGKKQVILDSLLDVLWNAIPSNVVEAAFLQEYTHVEALNQSSSDDGLNTSAAVYQRTMRQQRGVNFMGVLCFSILFGYALAVLGEKGQQLHQVIEQLNAVIMSIMGYSINLLPLGMFFWMIREGMQSGGPGQILGPLGMYFVTFLGGFVLHVFVLLPVLYLIIVRKNPLRYHRNLLPTMLTAFGTSSSCATLPMTMHCVEESNGVSRRVTSFVLPLGVVLHMNGGSYNVVLSSIFLAQLEGIDVGISETIAICAVGILMVMSAPGTVSNGNPAFLFAAMAAGGLSQPKYVTVLMSIEWLLDRFRTVMNVMGDCYVAAFVESLCRNRLSTEKELDDPPVLE